MNSEDEEAVGLQERWAPLTLKPRGSGLVASTRRG